MTLHLPRAEEQKIRAHGVRTYNEECCGVLIGTEDTSNGDDPAQVVVRVDEARPMDNTKDVQRERRYIIDPLDLMKVEDELEGTGRRVVGFYHSHPDHPSRPSQFDQDHAWPGLSYVIIAVAGGTPGDLTSWRLSLDRRTFHPEPVVVTTQEEEGRHP